MRRKFYAILFFTTLFMMPAIQPCRGQVLDTLRVMHYNLLNYGKTIHDCADANNGRENKTAYLRTILEYARPDILTVNEMDGEVSDAEYLLNNALNADDSQYERASFSGEYLVNMLYYNADKLALKSQDRIITGSYERDINVYRLYYLDNLVSGRDTTFLTCFVVHLKAGTEEQDKALRAQETQKLMEYRREHNIRGNILVMGDMNLYSGNEIAFRNLTGASADFRFYDPLNASGEWHESADFAAYHTQSTHMQGDCAAGGGLDDRFDLILMSDALNQGSSKMRYLNDSYEAIGQDGQHYNQALNEGANQRYDADLVDALYQMSDHLPVMLKLQVLEQATAVDEPMFAQDRKVWFNNPVRNELRLSIDWGTYADLRIEILSLLGKTIYHLEVNGISGMYNLTIPVSSIQKGMYILKITDQNKQTLAKKLLKY